MLKAPITSLAAATDTPLVTRSWAIRPVMSSCSLSCDHPEERPVCPAASRPCAAFGLASAAAVRPVVFFARTFLILGRLRAMLDIPGSDETCVLKRLDTCPDFAGLSRLPTGALGRCRACCPALGVIAFKRGRMLSPSAFCSASPSAIGQDQPLGFGACLWCAIVADRALSGASTLSSRNLKWCNHPPAEPGAFGM